MTLGWRITRIHSNMKQKRSAPDAFLQSRFQAKDSQSGLSKASRKKGTTSLGMPETQTLHQEMVLLTAGQDVQAKAVTKALPVKLNGMDLVPLSNLMRKHDPCW